MPGFTGGRSVNEYPRSIRLNRQPERILVKQTNSRQRRFEHQGKSFRHVPSFLLRNEDRLNAVIARNVRLSRACIRRWIPQLRFSERQNCGEARRSAIVFAPRGIRIKFEMESKGIDALRVAHQSVVCHHLSISATN